MNENIFVDFIKGTSGERFLVNLVFMIILTRGLYYSRYKRREPFLGFFSVNVIIFFIAIVLNRVSLSTGAAFGLFAVFSMLRYRTEGLTPKDMTYLFISIALGLLSATCDSGLEFLFVGGVIMGMAILLEAKPFSKREYSREILYDNFRFLHENNREELMADIKNRTGLNVTRIEIKQQDFLRDSATVVVYYE